MKIAINALVLSSLIIGSASAVTIAMDRGTTTGMVVINPGSLDPTAYLGSRVAIGSLVRWGTMNGAVSPANFVEFATTTVNNVNTTTLSTVGGSIRDSIAVSGTLAAAANIQVYMWVYGAPTASTTVNQGLFTSTAWKPGADFASDGSATFTFVLGQNIPATSAGPTVTSIALSNMTTQAKIEVGALKNSTTGTENAGAYIYTLGTAIPEPSAALLGAIGALGLLRRRRI